MKLTRSSSCFHVSHFEESSFIFYPESEDDICFIRDIIRWMDKIKTFIKLHPRVKDIKIDGFPENNTQPLRVTVLIKRQAKSHPEDVLKRPKIFM